jgi:hypothetical protein
MTKHQAGRFFRPSTLAAAVVLALAGCGGGSSSNPSSSDSPTPTPSPAVTISGTAAAGAPLVGSVTVKDANGASKTVTIGTNGAYSVDVSDMTAPFVFRATGSANGRQYTIHSGATSADANGTINITPLTDLVIANIAGQIADNYFASGDFAGVTQAQLDAEAAKLREKLLPVLQALGVEAGIDLLRSQFTPNADALDKALDLIAVSVDPASNVATLTNVVTGQQILDDLATQAAAETNPSTMDDTTNVATAADDVTLIKQLLADFSAKFATGLPAASELLPLISNAFLNAEIGKAAFADGRRSPPRAAFWRRPAMTCGSRW